MVVLYLLLLAVCFVPSSVSAVVTAGLGDPQIVVATAYKFAVGDQISQVNLKLAPCVAENLMYFPVLFLVIDITIIGLLAR
jgi:hypothetical protein